ncbi:MAG: hypothetical protein A2293_02225 [Elusimicrobia bacterium RIFOXYB2_FULL_49_7]|nr:MAG: hypothetical protein A2293_02225 [Elusimicrobia bacterium RIFOXYB2_FULL_49_7]
MEWSVIYSPFHTVKIFNNMEYLHKFINQSSDPDKPFCSLLLVDDMEKARHHASSTYVIAMTGHGVETAC